MLPTANCLIVAAEFFAVGTPYFSFLKVLSRMAGLEKFVPLTVHFCLTSASYEASKGMQSAAKRLTGFDIVCLILTSIK